MDRETKQLKMTERGITQSQNQAMGGSIVKGLIELITNSHDAYGNNPGDINIIYQNGKISVIDNAGGIKNVAKSLEIGARSADFYNSGGSRGRLGRGLKDVPILAENNSFILETIHNGEYTKLVFQNSIKYIEINLNTKATKEDYKSIGCDKKGGTKISFKIKNNINKTRFENLASKLSDDFELRGIFDERNVYLSSGRKRVKINCSFDKDNYLEVFNKKIEISNYGKVDFKLYKLPKPSVELPSATTRTAEAGILIRGKNNIFENTLLGFKRRNGSPFFHGVVTAPQIDELYFEYDKNEKNNLEPISNNPIPIISPSRLGLDRSHPFTKEMLSKIEDILLEEFDKFDEEMNSSTNILDKSSQAELVKELSKLMQSIFDENLDVNNEITLNDDLELRPYPTNIKLNHKKNISVLASVNTVQFGDQIEITINNQNVSYDEDKIMVFGSHRNKNINNVLTAQFSLYGESLGASEIEVTIPSKDLSRKFNFNVNEDEIETIDEFSFSKKVYTTKLDKSKTVTILCPTSDFESDKILSIELSNNDEFELVSNNEITLEPIPELDCFGAYIEIKPKPIATVDSFTHVNVLYKNFQSKCRLKVKKDTLSGITLIPDFNDDPTNLPERAKVSRSDDKFIVTVYLKHQAVKEIIQDKRLIDTSESRVLLAEIIGEAVLLFRLQEDLYEEDNDVVSFVYNLSTLKGEHMHKFHKIFASLDLKSR